MLTEQILFWRSSKINYHVRDLPLKKKKKKKEILTLMLVIKEPKKYHLPRMLSTVWCQTSVNVKSAMLGASELKVFVDALEELFLTFSLSTVFQSQCWVCIALVLWSINCLWLTHGQSHLLRNVNQGTEPGACMLSHVNDNPLGKDPQTRVL